MSGEREFVSLGSRVEGGAEGRRAFASAGGRVSYEPVRRSLGGGGLGGPKAVLLAGEGTVSSDRKLLEAFGGKLWDEGGITGSLSGRWSIPFILVLLALSAASSFREV